MIKILSIDIYRDGGTLQIKTDVGEFCIDGRIGSKTKAVMYSGYPDKSEITDPELAFEILKTIFYDYNLAKVGKVNKH